MDQTCLDGEYKRPTRDEKIYEPKCKVTRWVKDATWSLEGRYTKYFNNLEKALDFAKEHHVTDDLNEDFEENCFTRVGAFTCSTIIKVWMYEDAKGNNLDKPICVWQRRVWS